MSLVTDCFIEKTLKCYFHDRSVSVLLLILSCFFALQYFLSAVPRSREVMQSWLSTIFSTFYSLVYSLFIVFSTPPDLVFISNF